MIVSGSSGQKKGLKPAKHNLIYSSVYFRLGKVGIHNVIVTLCA